MRRSFLHFGILGCVFAIAACAPAVPNTDAPPEPLEIPLPTETTTQLPTATPTATVTLTATPTPSPSQTAQPSATIVRGTPTRTATPRPPAKPSPTLTAAQMCANLMPKGRNLIYVMYVHPNIELIWDTEPRYFLAGLCNTIPVANGVPQGRYMMRFNFPFSNQGSKESKPTPAELRPGFNEVNVGPWVPGYENHITRCATRAIAETQVTYNDTPDTFYHVLPFVDGSDHISLPIKCGGNYP